MAIRQVDGRMVDEDHRMQRTFSLSTFNTAMPRLTEVG